MEVVYTEKYIGGEVNKLSPRQSMFMWAVDMLGKGWKPETSDGGKGLAKKIGTVRVKEGNDDMAKCGWERSN